MPNTFASSRATRQSASTKKSQLFQRASYMSVHGTPTIRCKLDDNLKSPYHRTTAALIQTKKRNEQSDIYDGVREWMRRRGNIGKTVMILILGRFKDKQRGYRIWHIRPESVLFCWLTAVLHVAVTRAGSVEIWPPLPRVSSPDQPNHPRSWTV